MDEDERISNTVVPYEFDSRHVSEQHTGFPSHVEYPRVMTLGHDSDAMANMIVSLSRYVTVPMILVQYRKCNSVVY